MRLHADCRLRPAIEREIYVLAGGVIVQRGLQKLAFGRTKIVVLNDHVARLPLGRDEAQAISYRVLDEEERRG